MWANTKQHRASQTGCKQHLFLSLPARMMKGNRIILDKCGLLTTQHCQMMVFYALNSPTPAREKKKCYDWFRGKTLLHFSRWTNRRTSNAALELFKMIYSSGTAAEPMKDNFFVWIFPITAVWKYTMYIIHRRFSQQTIAFACSLVQLSKE